MTDYWAYRGIQHGDGTTKRPLPLKFSAKNPRGFAKRQELAGNGVMTSPKKRQTMRPRKKISHGHKRGKH